MHRCCIGNLPWGTCSDLWWALGSTPPGGWTGQYIIKVKIRQGHEDEDEWRDKKDKTSRRMIKHQDEWRDDKSPVWCQVSPRECCCSPHNCPCYQWY